MIVWQGFGIGALFLAALPAGVEYLLQDLSSNPEIIRGGFIGSCVIAAIACWFIGKKLNQKPAEEFINPNSGERILFKKRHSLMFIPFEYWFTLPLGLAVHAPLTRTN